MKNKFFVILAILLICMALLCACDSAGVQNAENNITVTFNSNGGSEVEPITVMRGLKIVEPSKPTKQGYTFAGWYKDEDCTQKWNFYLNSVKENITLYAKWIANETSNDLDCFYYEQTDTDLIITGLKDESLTSLVIPDGVTIIGYRAFYECSDLTSVTIPSSVVKVCQEAFYMCENLSDVRISSLEAWCEIWFCDLEANPLVYAHNLYLNGELIKDLVIPDCVRCINGFAFAGCDFNSITLGEHSQLSRIGEWVFGEGSVDAVYVSSIEAWCGIFFQEPLGGYNLYINGELATNIVIPDSVTSIGDNAFNGCNSLTRVVISDSVTSVGDSSFAYCRSLTSIVIPDSVTSVGDSTFAYCRSLTSIVIPNSVTSIGSRAFDGCSSLTSIVIPDGVTSIGDFAFNKCDSLTYNYHDNGVYLGSETNPYLIFVKANDKSITSCSIHKGTKYIDKSAFEGCSSLTSVVIPDSVTSIGSCAFEGCSSLTSVVIPDSVTSIGSCAFEGCSSLTSVAIPDSVTSIGDFAFELCESLTSAAIPSSVANVGYCSFTGCSSLTYNSYDNGLYLGNDTNPYLILVKAKDTSITSCIIHEDTKYITEGAFAGCNSLTYNSYDNGLYLGNDTNPYLIFVKAKDTSITSCSIHEGTKYIDIYAFYDCNILTSVVIPDSVTSIGTLAFYGCSSLTSVSI